MRALTRIPWSLAVVAGLLTGCDAPGPVAPGRIAPTIMGDLPTNRLADRLALRLTYRIDRATGQVGYVIQVATGVNPELFTFPAEARLRFRTTVTFLSKDGQVVAAVDPKTDPIVDPKSDPSIDPKTDPVRVVLDVPVPDASWKLLQAAAPGLIVDARVELIGVGANQIHLLDTAVGQGLLDMGDTPLVISPRDIAPTTWIQIRTDPATGQVLGRSVIVALAAWRPLTSTGASSAFRLRTAVAFTANGLQLGSVDPKIDPLLAVEPRTDPIIDPKTDPSVDPKTDPSVELPFVTAPRALVLAVVPIPEPLWKIVAPALAAGDVHVGAHVELLMRTVGGSIVVVDHILIDALAEPRPDPVWLPPLPR